MGYVSGIRRRGAQQLMTEGMAPLEKKAGRVTRYHAALRLGELCSRNGDDILAHMSTASAARDILAITDRIEEHRKGGNFSVDSLEEEEKPRVNFFGVPYGTVLANTLVSMFPGRLDKILMDGVDDPDDYVNGVSVFFSVPVSSRPLDLDDKLTRLNAGLAVKLQRH